MRPVIPKFFAYFAFSAGNFRIRMFPTFLIDVLLSLKVFAARANFPVVIQTISFSREFTAETRSTLRKESYEAKLGTPRPLCLCGQSFLCSFGCGSAAL